ncbi:apolipoprotein N-acyltransferase [Hyphomicrobium sp. xq]|uniref:Apolipoprotein N-acyltransferase n=2 Tax=Hyphomicrobium album TaxID=2665159 RepID=A0A6I3KJU0_9HYPH|nr:apolipoprotein N-acyltransferase [Hyphomicrobium album]
MAPFFLSPVLFVTLPVLVWLIDGAAAAGPSRRGLFLRAASAGWWFGFGYFLLGLFWIGEAFLVEADKFAWLMPFAVLLLPAGLALFTALAAGAARLAWVPGMGRALVLAVTLGIAEWLRGHVLTGFPWSVLGYALTWPLPLMQSASVFGIYGLTLLCVAIFAGPFVILADVGQGAPSRRVLRAGLLAVVPLVTLYTLGTWRLAENNAPMLEGVRVRIVQASVPQRDKWRPELQRQIFEDQLSLSRRDPAGRVDNLAGVTHLIWPEAAMPFLPLEQPEALAAIGELLPDGTQLLSGALRLKHRPAPEPDLVREGYNSLMVFGDKGNLEQIYDKIHLVPFGEYLPMQGLLESIGLEQLTRWRGGFSIGATPRPLLKIPGLPPALGLICYEAVFPAAIVQGGQRPGLLINVTNDGWFGDTTGPWQHFHQTRVRAVEEGLPIIRSANNGVSAIVDGTGRVVAMLTLNARGNLDSGVPSSIAAPVYAKLGDCTFVGLLLIFLGVVFMLYNRRTD